MTFLKRYWLFLLLAGVAAFLAFLWFQGQQSKDFSPTPQPATRVNFPPLEGQKILASTPVTIEIGFESRDVNFYKITPKGISQEQALTIAKSLGFTKEPIETRDAKTGIQYIWNQSPKFLFITLNPVDILFGVDPVVLAPTQGGEFLPQETAAASLQSLLTELDLAPPGAKFRISFEKLDDENLSTVGFSQILENGGVVLGSDPKLFSIKAAFEKSGQLYRFSYQNSFSLGDKLGTYPSKDLEEIKQSLVSEGRIVFLEKTEDIPSILPKSIKVTGIENGSLFLKHDPTTLYPILILAGEAATPNGNIPIYVYIPAPKSTYLSFGPEIN